MRPYPGHRTHFFVKTADNEVRCAGCDCRPMGKAATAPCDSELGRERGLRFEEIDLAGNAVLSVAS